jgi:hypothetical protein
MSKPPSYRGPLNNRVDWSHIIVAQLEDKPLSKVKDEILSEFELLFEDKPLVKDEQVMELVSDVEPLIEDESLSDVEPLIEDEPISDVELLIEDKPVSNVETLIEDETLFEDKSLDDDNLLSLLTSTKNNLENT